MLLVMRVLSIIPLNFKASRVPHEFNATLGVLFTLIRYGIAPAVVRAAVKGTSGVQLICALSHTCATHAPGGHIA